MEQQQFKYLKKNLKNSTQSKSSSSGALKNTASSINEEDSTQLAGFEDENFDSFTIMGSISEGVQVQKVPKVEMSPRIPRVEAAPPLKNPETLPRPFYQDSLQDDFVGKNSDLDKSSETTESTQENNERMNQALWEAAESNQYETCRMLLDKSLNGDMVANVNSRMTDGLTALHLAALKGHVKVCETLLDYGDNTDLNSRDLLQRTPLHLACLHAKLQAAQLLVRSGAFLNAADVDGNTPLHYAVLTEDKEFLHWILCRFPDLTVKNNEGKTAFEMTDKMSIQELAENKRAPPPILNLTPQRIKIRNSIDELTDFMMQGVSRRKCPFKIPETPQPEKKKISPLDFQAIQQIGKGSFGEVFLVEKKDSHEQFAMKILQKSKVMRQNIVKYAMTERNVLSYMRHPFIVGLKYAFQTQNKLFLILDYCPGGDLGSHIAREKRFSETRARIYLCEILAALEELHRRDIIFRDLKPDNVVLDSEGHAMLTDFGLSKEGVLDNFSAKSFCGSVAYLAPEMLKRQGHGKAVDWYLLGVLLYEMLVGIPPYFSHNKDQLFHNIQHSTLKIPTSLSSDAKSLLKGLLQREPSKRLGSRRDAEEIKEHHFFYGINWDSVMRRELRPPRPPKPVVVHGSVPQERVVAAESLVNNETTHLTGWTFVSE